MAIENSAGFRAMRNMIALKQMNPEERARLLTELEAKVKPRSHSPSPPPSSIPLFPPRTLNPPQSLISTPAMSSPTTSPETDPTKLAPAPASPSEPVTLMESQPPQESSHSSSTSQEPESHVPDGVRDNSATKEEQVMAQERVPQPTSTVASADDSSSEIPSAVKSYFLNNILDEHVCTGFFAVPREFVQLPTLTELRLITPIPKPPFNSTLTHIFVIDFADDRVAALRKKATERLAATRSKRFAAKIKELLVVLREQFPYIGPYAAHTEISHLTKERNTVVLPVGAIKKVSHEELAVLFKLLCEDAAIDCRVVRGKNPQNKECAWNFVREDLLAKWNLVSVVNATMSPNTALEATEYTLEGSADNNNGMPPDGPFPPLHPPTSSTASAIPGELPAKPRKPVIRCTCHIYEETSPMLTCTSCKKQMHGPCQGFMRLEDLPATFKCQSCIANPPPPPPAPVVAPQVPTTGITLVTPKSQPLKLKLILKSTTGASIETRRDIPPEETSPSSRKHTSFNLSPRSDDESDDDSYDGFPSEETSSRQVSDDEDGSVEDDTEALVVGKDDDGNWGGKGGAIIHRSSSSGSEKGKRGRPAKPNSKRSQKPKPDPHAPLRPISCYHIFCKEVRAELLKTRTDVSYPVIGQIAGERWKKLPEETKEGYIRLAKEHKQIYEREMIVYKKTEHHREYLKYLEEFFSQRPAAVRKRTVSDTDSAPQTPRQEAPKKPKMTPSPAVAAMLTRKASSAGVELSPVTPKRPGDAHPGGISRRRTSSVYDIDDFLPSIAAPSMITPIRVREVFVPNWRESEDVDSMDEGDDGEDTSDETYRLRHEKFENAERNRLPLPIERRFSVNLSPPVERQQKKKKSMTPQGLSKDSSPHQRENSPGQTGSHSLESLSGELETSASHIFLNLESTMDVPEFSSVASLGDGGEERETQQESLTPMDQE